MRHLQRFFERIPAPLLAGVLVVLVAAAWANATNVFDSDVSIFGDIRGSQAMTVTQLITTADISVTDDATVADVLTVGGKSTFADSVYLAGKLTSATTIKADAVVWVPYTGALPDTDAVVEGYSVVRGGSLYIRRPADDGWVASEFQ